MPDERPEPAAGGGPVRAAVRAFDGAKVSALYDSPTAVPFQ